MLAVSDTDRATEQVEPIACRVYTHARRHPIVIGNIQGLRIPPVTPAQLGLLVGGVVFLAVTRTLWAHFGAVVNVLVLLGVPLGLAWSARAVRMEGRAPWRAALGWLQLFGTPSEGECLGRRVRRPRTVRYRGRTWVADVAASDRPLIVGGGNDEADPAG
jgi:hypothetical protein